MAQGFYNAQEACAKLKKTEDELRKLVRDGQLREFRDARGVMYRAQEIDTLAGSQGGGQDSVADLSLADSAAPAKPDKPATPAKPDKPAAPAKPQKPTGDTSVFNLDATPSEADAAKTDVFSLEPAGEGGDEKKSGSGSGSSISLLDDLENITIPADPMAETVVSGGADLEGLAPGGAGGSGLLDLAKESDDTSLGAELYDESGEASDAQPVAAAGTGAPSSSAVAEAPVAPAPQMDYYVAPVMAEASDPMAPAFIGMSIIGFIALLIAGMAVAAAVIGSWPSLLSMLYSSLGMYTLGAILVTLAAGGIGWAMGRQTENRRHMLSRAGAGQTEALEAEQEG